MGPSVCDGPDTTQSKSRQFAARPREGRPVSRIICGGTLKMPEKRARTIGKFAAATLVPPWREYGTTSRRTSLVIDPPDGRLPPRTPQAPPLPVQRCGSLLGGEPCDSYDEYGLGVRCIVHGGGLPDAMFPAVYNANMRIMQAPG